MIWRSIQYEWPQAGLLLIFAVLIAWAWYRLNLYRANKLAGLADEKLLNAILEKREPVYFWLKVGLCCLVWMGGILALMQPKGNERYVSNGVPLHSAEGVHRKKMAEVVLLIDASASMNVKDVHAGLSRENAAKQIAEAIISKMEGENISLYAFTSALIQQVPSTTDYLFARLMLRQLRVNQDETSGTDLKQALEVVRLDYFKNPLKPKVLILLSDGGDTHYESLVGQERQDAISGIVEPLKDIEEQNITAYVVGMGSLEGGIVPEVDFEGHTVHSSLEEDLLRRISVAGNGEYFSANEMSTEEIAHKIAEVISLKSGEGQPIPLHDLGGERSPVYDLYFQIPLGMAMAALILFLTIPDTRRRKHAYNEAQ